MTDKKEKTFEVYCLAWTASGNILKHGGNYTDKERAERHCEHANKHLKWTSRLTGHHWFVKTLIIKEGPKS